MVTSAVLVTCTPESGSSLPGVFYVDTYVLRPTVSASAIVLTVEAVGVDEGDHGSNNSRDFTVD